jgi:hypothetical protein
MYFRFFHLVTAFFFLINHLSLLSLERGSSAPFISGDTFRSYADHIFDETTSDLIPRKVKTGDLVFVKTDYLETFFAHYHPLIKEPYILLTHNSDHPAPGPCFSYLDDPKLLAWFAQNVEVEPHPKLHPIPIGIANKCWEHGNPNIFLNFLSARKNQDRPILCYLNFAPSTYPKERPYVWNLFYRQPWCVVSQPKALPLYLRDLSQSKFVLSPRGNGLDCHRTWEALLLGAIPILRTSTLDPLLADLPVLIVDEWETITESYLNKQYESIKQKSYNLEKIFIKYWIQRIRSKVN